MIGKVVLAGGPKCPICGKEFKAEAPLRPNVEDREFYGGRVKFFKEVDCDCEAKYDLCIEKIFSGEGEELRVINMIVLKEGRPLSEIKKENDKKIEEEANQKAMEAIVKAIEEGEKLPTLQQRQEIKKETILATILDKDEKMATLMCYTEKELRRMCKSRKLKVLVRDNKKDLAERLLVYDPTIVVPGPKNQTT